MPILDTVKRFSWSEAYHVLHTWTLCPSLARHPIAAGLTPFPSRCLDPFPSRCLHSNSESRPCCACPPAALPALNTNGGQAGCRRATTPSYSGAVPAPAAPRRGLRHPRIQESYAPTAQAPRLQESSTPVPFPGWANVHRWATFDGFRRAATRVPSSHEGS